MLYVKTQVRSSTIEGLGLFAAEDIPAGTLIARWEPVFGATFTDEERAKLHPMASAFLHRYGWRAAEGRWVLDLDDSRFMNHSDSPNMVVNADGVFTSRAARDIAAGEELTEDYRQFDPDFDSYAASWSVP